MQFQVTWNGILQICWVKLIKNVKLVLTTILKAPFPQNAIETSFLQFINYFFFLEFSYNENSTKICTKNKLLVPFLWIHWTTLVLHNLSTSIPSHPFSSKKKSIRISYEKAVKYIIIIMIEEFFCSSYIIIWRIKGFYLKKYSWIIVHVN